MRSKSFPSTEVHYRIIREAVRAIYKQHRVYTRKEFAKEFGFPDNRHTHNTLDTLVEDGVLFRVPIKFPDTHERLVYTVPPCNQTMEAIAKHITCIQKIVEREWKEMI